MAREFDVILFGASGFTGKNAIPILWKEAQKHGLKWAIAGRSEVKLREVLEEMGMSTQNIPVVIADCNDQSSLLAMSSRTRLILNCCGPFALYGHAVAEACISTCTHHIDLTIEPQFYGELEAKYGKTASEKNIFFVNACGFSCLPTEMLTVYLQENFEGSLNSVEIYVDFMEKLWESLAANTGTWHSIINILAEWRKLCRFKNTGNLNLEPKLSTKLIPHKREFIDGWAMFYPLDERSLIRKSQQYFYEHEDKRPIQVEVYFTIKNFLKLIPFIFTVFVVLIFSQFEWGRDKLFKYSEWISFGTFKPIESKEIRNMPFKVTAIGKGWRQILDKNQLKCTKPMDGNIIGILDSKLSAYEISCVGMVLCGIILLTETDKLPRNGGVYSPGAFFAKTSLIKQLDDNGAKFKIIKQ